MFKWINNPSVSVRSSHIICKPPPPSPLCLSLIFSRIFHKYRLPREVIPPGQAIDLFPMKPLNAIIIIVPCGVPASNFTDIKRLTDTLIVIPSL